MFLIWKIFWLIIIFNGFPTFFLRSIGRRLYGNETDAPELNNNNNRETMYEYGSRALPSAKKKTTEKMSGLLP